MLSGTVMIYRLKPAFSASSRMVVIYKLKQDLIHSLSQEDGYDSWLAEAEPD
jgi:hypothetical protein